MIGRGEAITSSCLAQGTVAYNAVDSCKAALVELSEGAQRHHTAARHRDESFLVELSTSKKKNGRAGRTDPTIYH